MRITRECWKCERCGHEWVAQNSTPPARCAKCKSRRWNAGGLIVVIGRMDDNSGFGVRPSKPGTVEEYPPEPIRELEYAPFDE